MKGISGRGIKSLLLRTWADSGGAAIGTRERVCVFQKFNYIAVVLFFFNRV